MNIDEDKTLLDISDHSLVCTWFKMSHTQQIKSRKPKYKNISWIKKDEESYEQFREAFRKLIGKKCSFNRYMEKLKRTLNTTLLKRKRIRIDKKVKNIILAAKWVDKELIDNLKIRSRLNRNRKFAK